MAKEEFGFILWILPISWPPGELDCFLGFLITSLTFPCLRKLLVMSGNLEEKHLEDWFLPPFLPKLVFLIFQDVRNCSAIFFWSGIAFGVSVRLVTLLLLASWSIRHMILWYWRMPVIVEIYFVLKDWRNLIALQFYRITVVDLGFLLLPRLGFQGWTARQTITSSDLHFFHNLLTFC